MPTAMNFKWRATALGFPTTPVDAEVHEDEHAEGEEEDAGAEEEEVTVVEEEILVVCGVESALLSSGSNSKFMVAKRLLCEPIHLRQSGMPPFAKV